MPKKKWHPGMPKKLLEVGPKCKNLSEAAEKCGIKENCLHLWRKKYPEWDVAVRDVLLSQTDYESHYAGDLLEAIKTETRLLDAYKKIGLRPAKAREWIPLHPEWKRAVEIAKAVIFDVGTAKKIGGKTITKYTKDMSEKFLAEARKGYTLSSCYANLGINPTTAKAWARDFPEWREVLAMAKALRKAALEKKLLTSEISGSTTAAIFALKSTDEEWRQDNYRQVDVNQTVTHEGSVKLENLSTEQLRQLKELNDAADQLTIEGKVVENDVG